MRKSKVWMLSMMALFVALNVVFVRFLSLQTPITRLSFGFVPDGVCAMMFGPWIGGLTAAISDVAGMLINSKGGVYFPGYTISAILSSIIYGLFLYGREKRVTNVLLCVLVQIVLVELVLGTAWGYLYLKFFLFKPKGLWLIAWQRLLQASVMLPLKVVVLYTVARALERTPYLMKIKR